MKPKTNLILAATVALASILTSGCVASYASIKKEESGTYLVTATKSKFAKARGVIYRCKPTGRTEMACEELSEAPFKSGGDKKKKK